MPSTKPRYPVTETDEVAAALAAAARRWPEDRDRPAKLLRHLIEEGHRAIEPGLDAKETERSLVLERVSGAYAGLYEPGYLDDLRAEWD